MVSLVCAFLSSLVYLFPIRVYCLAIPSPGTPRTTSTSSQLEIQQQVSFVPPDRRALRDCSLLINESFSPIYDWTSPTALALAQCLLTHNPQPNQCVFYTRKARQLAIQYALETNRTTIYDVYPPIYFNVSVSPARQWSETEHLRDLFRITSKAYAIACSGSATLVMPEDEEPCPDSIWVTDECDAIRNGLSRIELPVWRVSWSLDKVRGAWGWVRRALSAASGGGEIGIGKRDMRDTVAEIWEGVQGRFVEPVADDVREKLEVMEEQWGWRWEEDGVDVWALAEGRCDMPQR